MCRIFSKADGFEASLHVKTPLASHLQGRFGDDPLPEHALWRSFSLESFGWLLVHITPRYLKHFNKWPTWSSIWIWSWSAAFWPLASDNGALQTRRWPPWQISGMQSHALMSSIHFHSTHVSSAHKRRKPATHNARVSRQTPTTLQWRVWNTTQHHLVPRSCRLSLCPLREESWELLVPCTISSSFFKLYGCLHHDGGHRLPDSVLRDVNWRDTAHALHNPNCFLST